MTLPKIPLGNNKISFCNNVSQMAITSAKILYVNDYGITSSIIYNNIDINILQYTFMDI